MNTFLVTYDLRGRDETSADYAKLIEHLKSYARWAKPLYSTWIIKTDRSAAQVRDAVQGHMDASDRLLVITTSAPAAWWGLSDEVGNWLKGQL